MPTTDSDNLKFVPGEAWRIVATLLDREGKPLDLTDASIGWTLLDQRGALVSTNAIIAVLDPPTAGIVDIELTAATTRTIAPGLYTDELQITLAGRTSIVRGMSIIVAVKDSSTS
jgi:hypothetical protein